VVGYARLTGSRGYFGPGFDLQLVSSVGVATFAVAFVSWILIAPARSTGAMSGAAAGFCTGLVSHPVTWMLFCWIVVLTPADSGQRPDASGVLPFSLILSFFSLVHFGIFTVSVTTLTGAIVGYLMSMERKPGEADEGRNDKNGD
jgi:hypothetical protein